MKTILITGATSGIGWELAKLYAQQNVRLVLIGRRPLARLKETLFTAENYCEADLSFPEAAETITTWLDKQHIAHIDVLIHNAAIGYYGSVAEQSTGQIQQMVQVNFKTPIALTHALLPRIKKVNGQIVFVSSVASVLPTAEFATYTATKAALDGFARSLRVELGNKVTVQVLHPGATNTGMHEKIGISREVVDWEKFLPVDEVAAVMARVIDHGRSGNSAIGLGNKLLRGLGRAAGGGLERLMRLTAKKPHVRLWPSTSKEKHVVITGVAEGIGKALALRFAWAGYQVTGIDVNVGGALETKAEIAKRGIEMNFIAADLASSWDVLKAAASLKHGRKIDVLIHNAGISAAGAFAQLPLDQQLKVVEINFVAPLLLTTEVLRQRALNKGGVIGFVSSLSYFVGYPGAAVYGGTKDGLSSYGRSLAVALAKQARILTVYPGPTRTAHARRYSPDNSREERRMPPEDVAKAIYGAVKRRQRTLLPGLSSKLFATFGYLAPRLAEQVMRRTLFEKMGEGG